MPTRQRPLSKDIFGTRMNVTGEEQLVDPPIAYQPIGRGGLGVLNVLLML